MKILQLSSLNSISHCICNITDIMKRHILERFPPNFFRHIQIATNIPSITERFKENTNMRNFVKLNPAISINPEWEVTERQQEGLANTSVINYEYDYDRMFENEDFVIKYELKQIKIKFSTIVRTDTKLKTWDITSHVNEMFKAQQHYYLSNVFLPIQIPMKFIKILSLEYALKNDYQILEFLRRFIRFQVHHNMSAHANYSVFTILFPINIRIKIDSVPSFSVNKTKKIEKNSFINFELESYTTIPQNFTLIFRESFNKCCSTDKMKQIDEIANTVHDEADMHIFMNINYDPPLICGVKNRELYIRFMVEVNGILEKITISELLASSHNRKLKLMVDYYFNHRQDPKSFIDTKLYLTRVEASEFEYTVDWFNDEIVIHNPKPNLTYGIAMYIDMEQYYRLGDENFYIKNMEKE